MTEDEAKTKWCPFARVPVVHQENWMQADQVVGAAGNRDNAFMGAKCIGSACMAWRTEHPEIRVEASRGSEMAMNEEAMKTKRRVRREHNTPRAGYDTLVIDGTGFCGLAGKP